MREPNLYRCAIPGAGVSSMELIAKEEWNYRFRDIFQRTRGGLSPSPRWSKSMCPCCWCTATEISLYPSGTVTCSPRELERLGKPYKYVKLIDAAHTVDTLGYQHSLDFYEALLEFLADDCGLQAR